MVSDLAGPAVIVTPTSMSISHQLKAALKSRGHAVLALSEIAGVDDRHRLTGVQQAETLLAPLREKLLAGEASTASGRIWVLPPDARWGVKRGVKASKPIYWAQVQVYMAYLAVERTLFVALDKDTQALRFELVLLDPSAAQALSDKAVAVIRAVEVSELLSHISNNSDFYICTFCPYRIRCHALAPGGNA